MVFYSSFLYRFSFIFGLNPIEFKNGYFQSSRLGVAFVVLRTSINLFAIIFLTWWSFYLSQRHQMLVPALFNHLLQIVRIILRIAWISLILFSAVTIIWQRESSVEFLNVTNKSLGVFRLKFPIIDRKLSCLKRSFHSLFILAVLVLGPIGFFIMYLSLGDLADAYNVSHFLGLVCPNLSIAAQVLWFNFQVSVVGSQLEIIESYLVSISEFSLIDYLLKASCRCFKQIQLLNASIGLQMWQYYVFFEVWIVITHYQMYGILTHLPQGVSFMFAVANFSSNFLNTVLFIQLTWKLNKLFSLVRCLIFSPLLQISLK